MKKTTKKKAPAKLVKPTKHVSEPYWDYHEVARYIEHKHDVQLENYAGWKPSGKNEEKPYQNFWHWISDRQEVHNGSHFYLNVYERDEPENKYTPGWVKEIL